MDRGTLFHTAMELLAEHNGDLSLDKVKAMALEVHKHSPFCDEARETGIIAIERYLGEGDTVDFSKVIETEKKIELDLPNGHEFIGYIDAVIDNGDGTVSLIDYKTYSEAPQEDKMKYSLQANMYMEVMTKLGYTVKDFSFECVSPKKVLKGRAYRTKRIKFNYNKYRGEDMFEQFCEITTMIGKNPNLRMYIPPAKRQPNVYDYFYKVYIGDVTEDLDDFVEKNFKKSSKIS
jgi:RecB family exonuclease